jgi:hypothetical protein
VTTSNKVLGVTVALAALALAAAYVASPVWAFRQLQEAARTGDRDQMEALVDFPAVRASLKAQVESKATKLAREASGIGWLPLQAIGKLGSMLGDRSIDKLVTPDAIALMVSEGENPRHHQKTPVADDATPAGRGEGEAADGEGPALSYAYLTADRFRVTVAPRAAPDLGIGVIMERRGLFSWRVEAIELAPRKRASDPQP